MTGWTSSGIGFDMTGQNPISDALSVEQRIDMSPNRTSDTAIRHFKEDFFISFSDCRLRARFNQFCIPKARLSHSESQNFCALHCSMRRFEFQFQDQMQFARP